MNALILNWNDNLKIKKKKILIVDDEIDMRIFISTLLETAGYKSLVSRNGKEGILKVKKFMPDLIILDVMMPEEGGVKMYRQLKTDNKLKNIPVIMLSAVAKKTFFHYLNMLNVQSVHPVSEPEAYMEKPPEATVLLKIIKQFVGIG
jgi:two-component system phosphate regulon response regulator PhoB